MARQIFVNLPVRDLERSKAFFGQLGYTFNPSFSDENAACMVVSDDIFVMLLVEPFFKAFTPKPVADATKATEVLIALNCDSREDVDRVVRSAVAAGGSAPTEAKDHGGFMYQHGYTDPDGHMWEVFWMDPAAASQGPSDEQKQAAREQLGVGR